MYQHLVLPYFYKQIKELLKKYPHIKGDIVETLNSFDKKTSVHLGNNTYKCRLKSSDISKGKNKSFRLILKINDRTNLLIPILIYFKGKIKSITKKELNKHLDIIDIESKQSNLYYLADGKQKL